MALPICLFANMASGVGLAVVAPVRPTAEMENAAQIEKEDKDGFLARVICQKCGAIIEVKTKRRMLKQVDDEALLKFFLLIHMRCCAARQIIKILASMDRI